MLKEKRNNQANANRTAGIILIPNVSINKAPAKKNVHAAIAGFFSFTLNPAGFSLSDIESRIDL